MVAVGNEAHGTIAGDEMLGQRGNDGHAVFNGARKQGKPGARLPRQTWFAFRGKSGPEQLRLGGAF